jgi:hypothetical protein
MVEHHRQEVHKKGTSCYHKKVDSYSCFWLQYGGATWGFRPMVGEGMSVGSLQMEWTLSVFGVSGMTTSWIGNVYQVVIGKVLGAYFYYCHYQIRESDLEK